MAFTVSSDRGDTIHGLEPQGGTNRPVYLFVTPDPNPGGGDSAYGWQFVREMAQRGYVAALVGSIDSPISCSGLEANAARTFNYDPNADTTHLPTPLAMVCRRAGAKR